MHGDERRAAVQQNTSFRFCAPNKELFTSSSAPLQPNSVSAGSLAQGQGEKCYRVQKPCHAMHELFRAVLAHGHETNDRYGTTYQCHSRSPWLVAVGSRH
jgi:hypothetical protein